MLMTHMRPPKKTFTLCFIEDISLIEQYGISLQKDKYECLYQNEDDIKVMLITKGLLKRVMNS